MNALIGWICPAMAATGYIIVAFAFASKPTFHNHNQDPPR